jgi:hypothetical protein
MTRRAGAAAALTSIRDAQDRHNSERCSITENASELLAPTLVPFDLFDLLILEASERTRFFTHYHETFFVSFSDVTLKLSSIMQPHLHKDAGVEADLKDGIHNLFRLLTPFWVWTSRALRITNKVHQQAGENYGQDSFVQDNLHHRKI